MSIKATATDLYAWWRFMMWIRGYGSYTEIDRAVERGDLIPGRRYPVRLSAANSGQNETNPREKGEYLRDCPTCRETGRGLQLSEAENETPNP